MPPDLRVTGGVGATGGLKYAVDLSLRGHTLGEAPRGCQRRAALLPQDVLLQQE